MQVAAPSRTCIRQISCHFSTSADALRVDSGISRGMPAPPVAHRRRTTLRLLMTRPGCLLEDATRRDRWLASQLDANCAPTPRAAWTLSANLRLVLHDRNQGMAGAGREAGLLAAAAPQPSGPNCCWLPLRLPGAAPSATEDQVAGTTTSLTPAVEQHHRTPGRRGISYWPCRIQ